MKKLITPILQSAVMVCFAADGAERKISGSFFQVVIDSGFLGILIIEDTRLNFSPARRGEICGTEFRDQRFCISGD